VSVYDVARALRLCLEAPDAPGRAFNIGSGQSASVRDIAERLAAVLDADDIEPEITGSYRVGDIRHCFADISLARAVLGYEPQISLEAGLMELAGWLSGQNAADRIADANAELAARGLTV
jgi:dTDP-L-rhamnose 4-epimerase